jgi:hypothetical protein
MRLARVGRYLGSRIGSLPTALRIYPITFHLYVTNCMRYELIQMFAERRQHTPIEEFATAADGWANIKSDSNILSILSQSQRP